MRYLFVLMLAGCASDQEVAKVRAQEAIARQGPYCETLGYQRGSEGWRQCITAREQQRDAQNRTCTVVYGSLVCN